MEVLLKITVEYLGFLEIDSIKSGATMELPDGTTAGEVFSRLALKGAYLKYVLPIINGVRADHDKELKDGDKLFIYLPVGGG